MPPEDGPYQVETLEEPRAGLSFAVDNGRVMYNAYFDWLEDAQAYAHWMNEESKGNIVVSLDPEVVRAFIMGRGKTHDEAEKKLKVELEGHRDDQEGK